MKEQKNNFEFCIKMIKEMKKGISMTEEYLSLDKATQVFLDNLMEINDLF